MNDTSREAVEEWIKRNGTLIPGDFAYGLWERLLVVMAERDAAVEMVRVFLRAPTHSSSGPGSANITVQEYNVRAAQQLVRQYEP